MRLHIHWHKTVAQNGYNGRRWLQECRCGHRRVREIYNSNPRPVANGVDESAFFEKGEITKAPPPPPPSKAIGPPVRIPLGLHTQPTALDPIEWSDASITEPWQCESLEQFIEFYEVRNSADSNSRATQLHQQGERAVIEQLRRFIAKGGG